MAIFNMNDLLGSIKDKAENVTKSAVSTATKLAKEEMMKHSYSEIQKLKDVQYAEIGKLIYQRYAEGENFDEFAENLIKVDSLNAELDKLKERISQTCDKNVCPVCGEFVDSNLEFCRKCGTKVN